MWFYGYSTNPGVNPPVTIKNMDTGVVTTITLGMSSVMHWIVFKNLKSGKYRILAKQSNNSQCAYISNIYLESLEINKYLAFKNNDYYAISAINYDINKLNYNPLTIGMDMIAMYENNTMLSLSELINLNNINNESFKPINKLNNFKIRKKKKIYTTA